VLALALLKENRKLSALSIFLPVALVIELWALLRRGIPEEVLSTIGIGPVIVSLAVGLALLCLFGEAIGRNKGLLSYSMAIIILLAAGFSGTVGGNAGRLDASTKIALTSFICWAAALLLALTIAAFKCRIFYSSKRFTAFFLLGSIVAQIAFLFLYAGMNWEFVTSFAGKASTAIIAIAIAGVIMGIMLFLTTLPFLLLLFRSDFYNSRFRSCLRLPAAATGKN
jgi:hypothetical protein